MARRVFFSFHHQNDSWRVSQVRNSWVTSRCGTNTFLDAASWEKVKKQGAASIRRWIDKELKGTSVTVVLIGEHTAERKYVDYEIRQSHLRGNGMLAIYIHGLKNRHGETSTRGKNPFDNHYIEYTNWFGFKARKPFSEMYRTYFWIRGEGPLRLIVGQAITLSDPAIAHAELETALKVNRPVLDFRDGLA
jgi:hypothetical protein